MKEIHKITTGFVTQRWDAKTKRFLGQDFTAGDQVDYEDENGEPINKTITDLQELEYRCFDMVQDPRVGDTFAVVAE